MVAICNIKVDKGIAYGQWTIFNQVISDFNYHSNVTKYLASDMHYMVFPIAFVISNNFKKLGYSYFINWFLNKKHMTIGNYFSVISRLIRCDICLPLVAGVSSRWQKTGSNCQQRSWDNDILIVVWWYNLEAYDDVIKWKHFPRYWPFLRGIHRSRVNSHHKGQWRGALMFSLICAWINGWVNNREAGDLRRHRAHYDFIVMIW